MPSWGTVTLAEAFWVVGFSVALVLSFLTHRAFSAVRRRPPVAGVPVAAQAAMAGYFVTLARLLIVKAVAGLLLGVYAALLPPPPRPPPAWIAAAGISPGVALICVLAAAMIWTSVTTFRVYRTVVLVTDDDQSTDDLALVPRRPDLGRRAYDRAPDEKQGG